jgi:hypothetical protein
MIDTSGQLSFNWCEPCGPPSSSESKSQAPTLSERLAAKLMERLDLSGSMDYRLIWKRHITPSGRLIYRLRASGRRISDKDFTGWPTPEANERANRGKRKHDNPSSNRGGQSNLADTAELAGWATPRDRDIKGADPVRSENRSGNRHQGDCLPTQAELAGWATTSARDWRDGRASQETMDHNSRPLNEQVVMLGPTSPSSTAETARPGVLEPRFSAWLMGFPESWDRNSPGWLEWQRLQDAIASGGCEGTATQSACR